MPSAVCPQICRLCPSGQGSARDQCLLDEHIRIGIEDAKLTLGMCEPDVFVISPAEVEVIVQQKEFPRLPHGAALILLVLSNRTSAKHLSSGTHWTFLAYSSQLGAVHFDSIDPQVPSSLLKADAVHQLVLQAPEFPQALLGHGPILRRGSMFKQQNEVDCGIFVLLGVEQLHQQTRLPEEESMEAAKRKKARMIKLCNALWKRKTSLESIGMAPAMHPVASF